MSRDRIQASFYATEDKPASAWWPVVEKLRNLGIKNAEKLLKGADLPEDPQKLEFNSQDDTIFSKGTKIKTLDQLLEAGDVNLEKWKVDKYIENSWGVSGKAQVPYIYDDEVIFTDEWIYSTNYQVKAWLQRRGLEEPDHSWTKKWLKELSGDIDLPDKQYIALDARPIVVAIGDLHIGAITKDTKVVPDYNKDVCKKSLSKIAWAINNFYGGRPVYFIVGGDLIESFTGKNHKNTWKEIELHGAKAALEAFKVLRDLFMSTKGFQKAYLVSGNHDRIEAKSSRTDEGQITELLHGVFEESTNLETEYDPVILSDKIDDVNYIIMHGHKGISNKSSEQLVIDYGDSQVFNQIVEFHKHHRTMDDDKYNVRRQKIPSLVKSTVFSQHEGFNSRSGFVVFERNDTGSLNYFNYDL